MLKVRNQLAYDYDGTFAAEKQNGKIPGYLLHEKEKNRGIFKCMLMA